MLHIDRFSVGIPAILLSDAVRDARRAIEQLLQMPDESRLQRRVPVNYDLLNDLELKKNLETLFAGKCAFCERKLENEKSLIVHHFRPIMNADNGSETNSDVHHYAWFAYDWNNIYPTCAECDRLSASHFPVKGQRAAYFSTVDEARESERYSLIDPCFDDPMRALSFNWNGYCVAKNDRGKKTIDVYSLNRSSLKQARSADFGTMIETLEKLHSQDVSDRELAQTLMIDQDQFAGSRRILLHRFSDLLIEKSGVSRLISKRRFSEDFIELVRDSSEGDFKEALKSVSEEHSSDIADEYSVEPLPYSEEPLIRYSGKDLESTFEYVAARPIKTISIQSFKAIGELKISLPERRESEKGASCLMLIGENATGKSSILEALALALTGPEAANQILKTPSTIFRRKGPLGWGLIDVDPVDVEIAFYDSDRVTNLHLDSYGSQFTGSVSVPTLLLAYGPRRYFTKRNKVPSKNSVGRVKTLFDPLATIPYPSEWLKRLNDNQFSIVARALREVLTVNKNDDLIRDSQLGVCARINGQLTPIEKMSEGYRSIFALVSDIVRELLKCWKNLEEARAVVLIDEIETHLHPQWKMKIVSSLRRAFPNVTFIATTHDPLCLRGLDDNEVQVLQRDSRQNIELLQDLPSIKGMRADQILTSEYFGLLSTADPSVEKEIAVIADSLIASQTDSKAESSAAKSVSRELRSILTLSEGPADQVVDDAMKQYLESRRGRPMANRSEARRKAVQAVLDAIEVTSKAEQ